MATYTEHYGLHQWEPTDDFLRTDFNTDFGKIDAALGEKADQAEMQSELAMKAKAVAGIYTGKGGTMEFSLGYRPKLVVIPVDSLFTASAVGSSSTSMLTLTDDGFRVMDDGTYDKSVNKKGTRYFYVAIR